MQDHVSIKRRNDDLKRQTEPPTKKKKRKPREIVELTSSEEEIEELLFALVSWLPNLNLSQKHKLELKQRCRVANLIISLCRTKSKILQDLGPFQLHFAGHL